MKFSKLLNYLMDLLLLFTINIQSFYSLGINKKHINSLLLIATIFFLFSKKVIAQNYQLQIINDNNKSIKLLTKKTYKKTFSDSLSLFSELEKIKSKLFQKGYISASFDSVIFDSVIARAYLFTGKEFTTQHINNKGINPKLVNKLKLNQKQISKNKLKPQELFNVYEQILEYYENNAYPFAKIIPKNVLIRDGHISLDIELQKNQKIKIHKVIIKGETKISAVFIKRYLSIFEEDDYNESVISEIGNKLNNLNFISQIRKPEVDFYGNKADIYIYLKDKKANKFDGVIGFIPDKENDYKLSFTGNINLYLINNLKKGEEMFLKWNRTKKLSQKLNIGTNIPYLFKSPFGTNFNFNLDKKDTTYMSVMGNLGVNYSFKNNDKIIAYIKNTSSYILSSKNIDTTIFKDVKTLSFGIAYNTQNINYIYNPSKGYYFLTDIASGKRSYNDLSNSNIEISVAFDLYIPIYRKLVYKISTKNNYMFSNEDLFQNELYKVGGFNSIRGFDEDAFFTSKFSVLTNEIRFLYEKKSNIYIFSDIASVKDMQDNLLLYGFGFGTSLSTKAGLFSISYALGKTGNNPIQISNSKVHLGYVNQF